MQIDIQGDSLAPRAGTLSEVVSALVERIRSRDAELDLSPLVRILVTDDFAAALAAHGAAAPDEKELSRTVGEAAGTLLIIDGQRLWQVLNGDGNEVARLIHHLHQVCWRIHDAAQAGRTQEPAPHGVAASPVMGALNPLIDGMWREYRINRSTAWSLPADSDLMMNHLAALLQALPEGMLEEATLYFVDQDMDALFAKSLGRIAHLTQTIGHVQGYLAGMERSLGDVSPELETLVGQSFLAQLWPSLVNHLTAVDLTGGTPTARALLATDIQGIFERLGLQLGVSEDKNLWVDVRPAVPERGTMH